MLNRRKKSLRFRGHHTHGYGSKKKHRGSGHQGGVGMAGTGKKADQKKPSIWKDTKYFGRHGFSSRFKALRAINIFYIEAHFDNLLKDGIVKKEADYFVVDLKDLRADKLLGSGKVTRKYKIIAQYASEPAKAKLAEKGGVVDVKEVKSHTEKKEANVASAAKTAEKKAKK